ncbi:hypothetical protein [Shewanella sp. NIFS-20-20]|uniref:hypothetical protein n=1 Tax=Shewanella sp. NIFS-20-20 TaxID=2853806 RepID=UPI001C44E6EC|nr:hypothetical protein [Shewanella sp. NIFS-20-20]MBV7317223.1 hypothetical protein [Shewanella sp. NIFS-20-20]
MLLKLFVTAVVIGLVWLMVSRRRQESLASPSPELLTGQKLLRKYMLTIALGLVLVSGMAVGAWHWFSQQQVVLVTIQSPTEGAVREYQVRKADIDGNRITTVDGLQIRFSTEDRVTISSVEHR